jgi:CO/xanthine dehydrogenase Mo-binding subunit
MSTTYKDSRRNFLKKISLTGGGLMLGFKWYSAQAEMPAILNAADPLVVPAFNSYLSIATDGMINIYSPNPELGQNIMTSFAQIVAEELDADWQKVHVMQAPSIPRNLSGNLQAAVVLSHIPGCVYVRLVPRHVTCLLLRPPKDGQCLPMSVPPKMAL